LDDRIIPYYHRKWNAHRHDTICQETLNRKKEFGPCEITFSNNSNGEEEEIAKQFGVKKGPGVTKFCPFRLFHSLKAARKTAIIFKLTIFDLKKMCINMAQNTFRHICNSKAQNVPQHGTKCATTWHKKT
jgi:hypothetical protein